MSQIIDSLKANTVKRREAPVLAPVSGLSRTTQLSCNLEPETRVLAPGLPPSPAKDRFQLLDHRLRAIRQTRPLSTLLITSSVPQEGKTLIATNLSITLSGSGQSVLLIDADMRRPSVGRTLGIEPRPGLAECLKGESTLQENLAHLPDMGIHYLSAGEAAANVGELLQRPAARSLLVEASSLFEWVIIDSPPVTQFADAHCLSGLADGTLMVARCGLTTNSTLKRSLEALDETAFVAGVLLNGVEDRRRHSYYGYYGAYTT